MQFSRMTTITYSATKSGQAKPDRLIQPCIIIAVYGVLYFKKT